MHCPVHVAVVVLVIVLFGFDDLSGFLSGCSVVEVDEGVVVYFPF
jgi:hypothetical protein